MDVTLETSATKVFATAAQWPGWSRSGRDGPRALAALAGYAQRYAPVAARAGVRFPADAGADLRVVEEVAGDGSTSFGVPGRVTEPDRAPLTAAAAKRRVDLMLAAWAVFDDIVAAAPEHLRKGPRGGGRDRDAVVAHVLSAEAAYGRQLGLRLAAPVDLAGAAGVRAALAQALRGASDGTPLVPRGWPPRYATHRIAWHVLDHAWEIEDKSTGDGAG